MAKKKKPPEAPEALHDRRVDAMFSSLSAKAREITGRDDVTVGDEGEKMVLGLPLPSLALRILYQSTVQPLGRIIQIAGQEGSCKSALLFENIRWHMMFGGGAVLAENENKDSSGLRNSIFWRNKTFMDRCVCVPTVTAEEWQQVFTQEVITTKQYMDERGGPGRTIPMVFAVDSLTATDITKEIEKTEEAGYATPGYALLAKSITVYMRHFVKHLSGYPFTIIGTNHLKKGTDARTGMPINNIPGGRAVPFHATYMIEMDRVGDIDLAQYGGIKLKMKMAKNSLGPSRRFIHAEMLWWREQDPNTGKSIQRHQWDWYGATVEALLGYERMQGKKELFKALRDICDFRVKNKPYVWSRALSIPESDPVHMREAGRLLETRPDLLQQMYPLLNITEYPVFQPGIDYRDAINAQRAAIDASAAASAAQAASDGVDHLPVLQPTKESEENFGAGETDNVVEEEPEPV